MINEERWTCLYSSSEGGNRGKEASVQTKVLWHHFHLQTLNLLFKTLIGMRCYGVQNHLKILKMDLVSTIAGWLAACLYRVVEVEVGLLLCLWLKGPLRNFLKESIAAILKPMLAATKCMLFRFYWIACGYWRSSWFWQPGQMGEEKRGLHFALSNMMMQHLYNTNMDVFLSESFAPIYILSLSLTYIVMTHTPFQTSWKKICWRIINSFSFFSFPSYIYQSMYLIGFGSN